MRGSEFDSQIRDFPAGVAALVPPSSGRTAGRLAGPCLDVLRTGHARPRQPSRRRAACGLGEKRTPQAPDRWWTIPAIAPARGICRKLKPKSYRIRRGGDAHALAAFTGRDGTAVRARPRMPQKGADAVGHF